MINVLSYIGMTVHSEVCLWTMLGLMRTIFDATLFRVNANLKQVWQMSMPEELSMPVQRVLRTMISGVMLAQCFTVYVYLASYIVVLYPVFLEERPNLVLPWLLLAAVRKLLCELMSLALGLGTCVLLGPARPPCIKFVIIKLISIMPAFYMWMLMYSYYHTLKVAAAFKTFPAVLPVCDQDYGLELAIRRRKTKSLLGEAQLRSKLVASLYGEERPDIVTTSMSKIGISSRMIHSTDTSAIDIIKVDEDTEVIRPNSLISNRLSESGSYEDWFGSEVVLPRGSDRILEQFVLMLMRIGSYLNKEDKQSESSHNMLICKPSYSAEPEQHNLNCMGMNSSDVTDTPLLVSSSKENTAQYLREYPNIFMRKTLELNRNDTKGGITNIQTRQDNEDSNATKNRKRSVTVSSNETALKNKQPKKGLSCTKHDPEQEHDSNTKSKNSDEFILKYADTNIDQSCSYRKMEECAIEINNNQSSESIINISTEKLSVSQNTSTSNNIIERSNTSSIIGPSNENMKEYSNDMNKYQSSDNITKSCPENMNTKQNSVIKLNESPPEIKIAESSDKNKKEYSKEKNVCHICDKVSNKGPKIIYQDLDSGTNSLEKISTKQSSKINLKYCNCDITENSDINVIERNESLSTKSTENQTNKSVTELNINLSARNNINDSSEETSLNKSIRNLIETSLPFNERNIGQGAQIEKRETENTSPAIDVEVLIDEHSHSSSLEHQDNDSKSERGK